MTGTAMTGLTPMAAAEAAMMRPWRWGEADCCAAACSAFVALHGTDPMAPLRGAYADMATARAAIERWGGWPAMAAALAAQAGLRPVDAAEARPGAIGFAPAYPALMLCVGAGAWAGKSLRGMTIIRTGIEQAWTVAR